MLKSEGYDQIDVDAVEVFQGQERKIIIVTTVRTEENLGFMADEKV